VARLPYLDAPDLPDEYRRVFDEIERTRGFVPNLYRVLAHSPDLMAEFLRMTTAVRAESRLPADLKELAILAVADATAAATIRAAHTSPAAAAASRRSTCRPSPPGDTRPATPPSNPPS
jgi:alkylhydroperoxidase family enzyme